MCEVMQKYMAEERAAGRAEGHAAGRAEKEADMAKAMRESGMPEEKIQEIIHRSREQRSPSN